MRKITALLIAASLLFLSSCSQMPAETVPATSAIPTQETEINTQPPNVETENPSAVYDAPMAAVALPLIFEASFTVREPTSSYMFPLAYYTHQDVQITLPDADVAQQVALDLLNRIDASRPAANKVMDSAQAAYNGESNWQPFSYAITYTPTRLDQNVLSLYGAQTSYDGSPRSAYNTLCVNYDLSTGNVLTLQTILQEELFADALFEFIIQGLSDYDQDALFSDYKEIIANRFNTNVPIENWYFTRTGLCFFFAPYEIAPYSSGVVVSEVPYSALSGILKDEFFPGEELSFVGSLRSQALTEDNMGILENYTQFAHVTLEPDTKQMLVFTEGSVSNVCVYTTADPSTGITEAAVLVIPGMGPSDAILLEVSDETAKEDIYITYESGGQLKTFRFTE